VRLIIYITFFSTQPKGEGGEGEGGVTITVPLRVFSGGEQRQKIGHTQAGSGLESHSIFIVFFFKPGNDASFMNKNTFIYTYNMDSFYLGNRPG
jgi:hypothetical protein